MDLEKNISPENDSIILSEKENDSGSDDDDSINMPGNENIIKVPPRPPIGSENYIIENNDPENNMVYERDQMTNTDDEEDDAGDEHDQDVADQRTAEGHSDFNAVVFTNFHFAHHGTFHCVLRQVLRSCIGEIFWNESCKILVLFCNHILH